MDDGERLFGGFVECEPFQRSGFRVGVGAAEDGEGVVLGGGNFIGVSDDLHPEDGFRNEGVERQNGEDGGESFGDIPPGNLDGPTESGFGGDGARRKVGVHNGDIIPVPHGGEAPKKVGSQQRGDVFQHCHGNCNRFQTIPVQKKFRGDERFLLEFAFLAL